MAKKRFQFSLRAWFILFTLATLVFVGWRQVRQRQSLQAKIIKDATLLYQGVPPRHERTVTSWSRFGTHESGPYPKVFLRDWEAAPWTSQVSKGAVAFCCFESLNHHGRPPGWLNDILATGELRRLALRQLPPDGLDGISLGLGRSRELKSLYLWANKATTAPVNIGGGLAGLDKLRGLKSLELGGVLADYHESLPQGLPASLEKIRISYCGLTAEDAQIFAPCVNLESLTLSGHPSQFKAIASVGLPRKLKKLWIGRPDENESQPSVSPRHLAALQHCHQLEELTIPDADFRGIGAKLPKSLKKIEIDGALLNADSFRAFAALPRLETLRINESVFQDEDLHGLNLPASLKTIGARNTSAGIHFSKALRDIEHLQSVNLHGNNTTDEMLIALGNKPDLTSLILNSKSITDESIDWLRPLKKLQRLQLIDCPITDALFVAAPHLKEVNDLRIEGSRVSNAMNTEIKEMKQERWRKAKELQAKMFGQIRIN